MKQSIQIQAVGRVEAKPAVDFKIGESMMWNFGGTTEILRIVRETAKMIIYELQGENDTHERKFKKDRLVAIG